MAHQGPLLKAGDIVRHREEDWDGVVIRERTGGGGFYLVVRDPLFIKALNLEKVEGAADISNDLRKLAKHFSSQTK